jgi:anti-anti-sigma factor
MPVRHSPPPYDPPVTGSLLAIDRLQGLAVIHTQGYIDNQGGEQIAGAAYQLIGDGYRVLLIDLTRTSIINSIGLSILIEIVEKLGEVGGKLAFCGLTPTIQKTFEIVGLTQYASIYADEPTAIAQLQQA